MNVIQLELQALFWKLGSYLKKKQKTYPREATWERPIEIASGQLPATVLNLPQPNPN